MISMMKMMSFTIQLKGFNMYTCATHVDKNISCHFYNSCQTNNGVQHNIYILEKHGDTQGNNCKFTINVYSCCATCYSQYMFERNGLVPTGYAMRTLNMCDKIYFNNRSHHKILDDVFAKFLKTIKHKIVIP